MVVLEDLPYMLVIVLAWIDGVRGRFDLGRLASRGGPVRRVRCIPLAGERLVKHVVDERLDANVVLVGADVGDQLDPGTGIRRRRNVVMTWVRRALGATTGGI